MGRNVAQRTRHGAEAPCVEAAIAVSGLLAGLGGRLGRARRRTDRARRSLGFAIVAAGVMVLVAVFAVVIAGGVARLDRRLDRRRANLGWRRTEKAFEKTYRQHHATVEIVDGGDRLGSHL